MKENSRLSFAKTIIAALAAVPIALVMSASASGQMHQDTPPTLQILDSSLIIESGDDLAETSSGGRFFYRNSTNPKIDHIRVITDNGDKIYEDLDADGPLSKIVITWINEDKDTTGDVIITGGTVFQISSDKKLDKTSQPKRRKFKFEHKGQGNGKRIRIESIEITNKFGRKTTFAAAPTGTGSAFLPDEFRILVWRE